MKLVWFRNDLRLDDHPALYYACEEAREQGCGVIAVYAVTPGQWRQHDEAPVKLGFRQAALDQLAYGLAQRGIPLELLAAEDFSDLPQAMAELCQQHGVDSLWFNEQSWHDEARRDQQVIAQLQKLSIRSRCFANELLVPAEYLRTGQGTAFKVFTPWYRRWLLLMQDLLPQPLPAPEAIAAPLPLPAAIQLPGSSRFRDDLWPVSEAAAKQALQRFIKDHLSDYADLRDYPARRGTSALSPYLASGLISARRCWMTLYQAACEQGWDWRANDWLRELAWRDFYYYLMIEFPQLGRDQPFKAETQMLQWEQNPEAQRAWELGLTGFPIIDAAMRQLRQTGWMHNRLRMLTASFYTKLLLLDWHEGEAFFMRHLIDGDFAANNGGWQWSASTGCDASPWFRVFSPLKQSERYDPQGHFIRKLVPELASLSAKEIHDPSPASREALGYPMPVIDYPAARQRVLARFGELNQPAEL